MRRGWEWTFLRICLGLAWLTTLSWAAVMDWPATGKFWYVVTYDYALTHELFFISGGWAAAITLTYFYQILSLMLTGKGVLKLVLKRVEKDL